MSRTVFSLPSCCLFACIGDGSSRRLAWGKLHKLPKVTDFFTSLGIPLPHANAVFVSNLELIGGVLLFVGLGSRFISLLLAGDMFVAYLASDREALRAIFSDPGKFYNADPYTFLFASLIILIFGPGLFSLDALLQRLWRQGKARGIRPADRLILPR